MSARDLLTTDVDRAVGVLRAGGLLGLPTETVYGLAADASNRDAIARIFATKERPTDHPLIVHLGVEVLGSDDLDGWLDPGFDLVAWLWALADTVWPGPLTVVVPAGPRVLDEVTGGRRSVGLRVPAHPLTAAVLERFGGGAAAPSANRFGRVSPTSAEHVLADIGDRLDPASDAVLDGGPCRVGVESTIVDLAGDVPQILRHGVITADDIERIGGADLGVAGGPARASGMLAAHYAPACEIILADSAVAAEAARRRVGDTGRRVDVLDRTADLVVAARQLYADLRAADAAGLDALVVVQPPAHGLGWALRDRLAKAAYREPR